MGMLAMQVKDCSFAVVKLIFTFDCPSAASVRPYSHGNVCLSGVPPSA